MHDLKRNIQAIEAKIEESIAKSGRIRTDIQVVAVTKSVSNEETAAVVQEGYNHVGENRPEGLAAKQDHLSTQKVIWHYIGNLQTRKVKQVINQIDYLHSLDRLALAKEIEKRANQTISCFVQVNVTGEESKSGQNPGEVEQFVRNLAVYPKIKVVGLMTMAPLGADEQLVRKAFNDLKMLQTKIRQLSLPHAPCTELSMGMSQDFPIAIEEGATFVRIGTSFFENSHKDKPS